ncbi:unnamed protein product [Vicia faba]|uniref:Uncharacterized protein n=1 Tax=Vicia faba TaxID=3906 RepID=A0AAV1AWC2_VICFA|nr:unnamed protein product [Vicia faba]
MFIRKNKLIQPTSLVLILPINNPLRLTKSNTSINTVIVSVDGHHVDEMRFRPVIEAILQGASLVTGSRISSSTLAGIEVLYKSLSHAP